MKNVFILFFMFLLTFFSKAQTNNHQKDTLLHLSKVVENMDFNPETKKYFNSIQTHFFYKNRNIQKEVLKTFLEEIPQKGNINTVYIYKKDKLYKMIVSENNKELENIVFDEFTFDANEMDLLRNSYGDVQIILCNDKNTRVYDDEFLIESYKRPDLLKEEGLRVKSQLSIKKIEWSEKYE